MADLGIGLGPCNAGGNPNHNPAPGGPNGGGAGGAAGAGQAVDPNEKTGAAGFGLQAYILPDTAIPYRIDFENLGPGSVPTPAHPATAPAQRVEVTDQLSTTLDWNTFQFTEFGWGDSLMTVSAGRANDFETVPMTYNNHTFDVQVELTFDLSTGIVSAVFQSLDPATSLPPDVLTGFLPPEDGTGIGRAHVSYTVQPKTGLASGTELRNVALIRFDGQNYIATNQIDDQNPAAGNNPIKEALNTIDSGAPTSAVTSLPAVNNARFTVHWSGADDAGGSGLRGFDVLVSDNGGPYTAWQTATTQTSATFTGQPGHTYRFYAQSVDNVGHVESAPASADAASEVGARIWHNYLNSLDVTGAGGSPDGQVVAGDALAIINYINSFGAGHIPANAQFGPPYLDTTGPGDTGDDFVVPADALAIINFINAFGAGLPGPSGEGENSTSTVKANVEKEVMGESPPPASSHFAASTFGALLVDVVHTQAAGNGESQPPLLLSPNNVLPLSSRPASHEFSPPAVSTPDLRHSLSKVSTDILDEFFAGLASNAGNHSRRITEHGRVRGQA